MQPPSIDCMLISFYFCVETETTEPEEEEIIRWDGDFQLMDADDRLFQNYGSAVRLIYSTGTLEYSMWVGNTGPGGSCLFLFRSQATVTASAFMHNSAEHKAGAILVQDGSTLDLTTSTFLGNFAREGAGMVIEDESSVEIARCSFKNNMVLSSRTAVARQFKGVLEEAFEALDIGANFLNTMWTFNGYAPPAGWRVQDTNRPENFYVDQGYGPRWDPNGFRKPSGFWDSMQMEQRGQATGVLVVQSDWIIRETPLTTDSVAVVASPTMSCYDIEDPCPVGYSCLTEVFSMYCFPCTGTDVGLDGRACTTCPAGFQASVDKTRCAPCGAGNFSEFGIQCEPCLAPRIISGGRSVAKHGMSGGRSCKPCLAGRGPNGNRTDCLDCLGNNFSSTGGICIRCPVGQAANPDHSGCENIDVSGDGVISDIAIVADVLNDVENILPEVIMSVFATDAELVDGSVAQMALLDSFQSDMASSLEVPSEEIVITGVGAGRRALQAVQLIAEGARGGQRRVQANTPLSIRFLLLSENVTDVLADLASQLTNPNSALMSGALSARVDASAGLAFMVGCPRGMLLVGGSRCEKCAHPDYLNGDGDEAQCRKCPANQEPNNIGDGCLCQPSYYNASKGQLTCLPITLQAYVASEVDISEDVCVPCGLGSEISDCVESCHGDELKIRAGWIQTVTADSVSIVECKSNRTNDGTEETVNDLPACSARTTSIGNNSLCGAGYTGVACGLCAAGYSQQSDGACELCQETGWVAIVTVLLLIVGGFFLLMTVKYWYMHFQTLRELLEVISEVDVNVMIKIVLVTLQLMGGLSTVLNLQFPPVLQSFFDWVAQLFRVDRWLISLGGFDCHLAGTYQSTLALNVGGIFIILLVVVAVYNYRIRKISKTDYAIPASFMPTLAAIMKHASSAGAIALGESEDETRHLINIGTDEIVSSDIVAALSALNSIFTRFDRDGDGISPSELRVIAHKVDSTIPDETIDALFEEIDKDVGSTDVAQGDASGDTAATANKDVFVPCSDVIRDIRQAGNVNSELSSITEGQIKTVWSLYQVHVRFVASRPMPETESLSARDVAETMKSQDSTTTVKDVENVLGVIARLEEEADKRIDFFEFCSSSSRDESDDLAGGIPLALLVKKVAMADAFSETLGALFITMFLFYREQALCPGFLAASSLPPLRLILKFEFPTERIFCHARSKRHEHHFPGLHMQKDGSAWPLLGCRLRRGLPWRFLRVP